MAPRRTRKAPSTLVSFQPIHINKLQTLERKCQTLQRPITRSETPIKRAILDAESTNQWAPKNNASIERPMKIIPEIMLLFYSSFLSLFS